MLYTLLVGLVVTLVTFFVLCYGLLYLIQFNMMLLHEEVLYRLYGTASTTAIVYTFIELFVMFVLLLICQYRSYRDDKDAFCGCARVNVKSVDYQTLYAVKID